MPPPFPCWPCAAILDAGPAAPAVKRPESFFPTTDPITAMEPFLILADLGNVRVLKYEPAGDDPLKKPHFVEHDDAAAKFHRDAISEVVTDQAGRVTRSGPIDRRQGMSYGEEHHLADELEAHAVRRVAKHIAEVVSAEGMPRWLLAAPRALLRALEEALPAEVRSSLARSECVDLVHLPLGALEQRFLGGRE